MGWFILEHVFSTIFAIITIKRSSSQEKDLEILILRQQLLILQRKLNSPIKPGRVEKITLAALTAALKRLSHRSANQLRDVLRIFQPETVLRRHREEVVHWKWTYPHKNKGGRPAISKELEELILHLAQENPRWGYGTIQGELIKLSFKVSQSTVRNVLDHHGIQPAVIRTGSVGWHHLMSHYKEQILACDFFTIQTVFQAPNAGFALSGKNAWIIFSLSMLLTCSGSCLNSHNTTILLAPIKVSINRCPYPPGHPPTLALSNVEKCSVESSIITIVHRLVMFQLPFDFTPVH